MRSEQVSILIPPLQYGFLVCNMPVLSLMVLFRFEYSSFDYNLFSEYSCWVCVGMERYPWDKLSWMICSPTPEKLVPNRSQTGPKPVLPKFSEFKVTQV
jgi:hypothetical protein